MIGLNNPCFEFSPDRCMGSLVCTDYTITSSQCTLPRHILPDMLLECKTPINHLMKPCLHAYFTFLSRDQVNARSKVITWTRILLFLLFLLFYEFWLDITEQFYNQMFIAELHNKKMGVLGCVMVCEGVWGCVNVWWCVRVCEGVWGCMRVCEGVWGCVRVYEGVWGCVMVCEGV